MVNNKGFSSEGEEELDNLVLGHLCGDLVEEVMDEEKDHLSCGAQKFSNNSNRKNAEIRRGKRKVRVAIRKKRASWGEFSGIAEEVKGGLSWKDGKIGYVGGAYKKEKANLLAKADELDKKAKMQCLSEQELNLKNYLKNRLALLLREEEIKWYQRAKTKRIVDGDRNTKYYHLIANGKHRKTRIFQLEQEEGVIKGDVQLRKYITKYYKNLFGPPEENNFSMRESRIEDIPQVSNEENDILTKANEQGSFHGVVPHLIDNGLSILQYADDTILFMEHDLEEAKNLKLVLSTFERLSGLKINFHKSELFCYGKAKEVEKDYILMFGCDSGKYPFRYLGIPMHHKKLSNKDWFAIEERFQKKLSSWKGKHLSVPKGILEKLDYYRSRFFWQSEEHKKKYRVHNGTQVRFWEDRWSGISPFAARFPELYNIARNKNESVAGVMSTRPLNVSFRRAIVGKYLKDWLKVVAEVILGRHSKK
uniref:Retrotransposon protein, putative, unclassified n=1 Tax=Oryza sativa subsp. japonica TaxID=39947 RepID=Q2QWS9_ORYSJ|nr:retrotransposon protein, putative, unclassified [Oryza sativa Japonica Group]